MVRLERFRNVGAVSVDSDPTAVNPRKVPRDSENYTSESESELFTGDTSKDNHSPDIHIRHGAEKRNPVNWLC